MNPTRYTLSVALWIMLGALAGPMAIAQVTDEQIGRTIERMKQYFYYKQDPQTGSWEFRSRPGGIESDAIQIGGETALVTQALLISGESSQNPKIAKAIKYLREVEMKGIYAVAFRAHVWANLPPEYMPMLELDASWLLDVANKHRLGMFDYRPNPTSDRVDHSSTQYGMLGLWEASKRGLKIPRKYWERWVEHFISAQRDDGGWTYSSNPNERPSGSMTAAGLTALFVGQQELYRGRRTIDPKLIDSVRRGVAWLDKRFQGHNNPGANEWTYYYLYGIERVALASGLRYLNNKDWYLAGASHILQNVHDNGSIEDDFVSTAFALMFLSRGRVPVWACKLQIPGKQWNGHPNDLYFLTHYLSNQCEQEINWEVVGIDIDAQEWLATPVAYLSSSEPMNSLTPKQKANLKKYLDFGGLLVANPEDGSKAFSDSIRALAAELYPQYEFQKMPPDHALFSCWNHIPQNAKLPVYSLSNGARELIILAGHDWGQVFQSEDDPGKDPVWDLATNIFAYATNRGALNNRLDQKFELRTGRSGSGQITVGRAQYDGNWLPEPVVWETQSNFLFNRTGLTITTSPATGDEVLNLEDLGQCPYKLVHLTGTHAIFLNEAQKKAIRQYVKRGGTLLIETVSGHGEFSTSIEKQLSTMFNAYAVPLTSSDAIISGQGLDAGQDNQRALYRRYAMVKLHFDPKPRLSAILNDQGQPMIIFSHEDLSLGMLGSRHWNIVGYQSETSRKLMANLVLWTNKKELQD